jgi:hypothetical protein
MREGVRLMMSVQRSQRIESNHVLDPSCIFSRVAAEEGGGKQPSSLAFPGVMEIPVSRKDRRRRMSPQNGSRTLAFFFFFVFFPSLPRPFVYGTDLGDLSGRTAGLGKMTRCAFRTFRGILRNEDDLQGTTVFPTKLVRRPTTSCGYRLPKQRFHMHAFHTLAKEKYSVFVYSPRVSLIARRRLYKSPFIAVGVAQRKGTDG